MTTELVRTEGLVSNFEEATRAAKAMALSGYFEDAKDISQAMVKVLAGHEMGFGPFASMTGIHVIQGKPAVGANLMAAAVKGHPRYDYRVLKMADDAVEIEYLQDGESIGISAFSAKDAQRAGTKNMGKFPRNMLFARAMSNGVRWFTPDVFAGNAVYTPDELGEVVEGAVVEIEPEPETPQKEDAATPVEAPHWIEDETTRKRFWAWASNLNLSSDDVHWALRVEHVADFPGDKAAAVAVIMEWMAERDDVAVTD